MYRDVRIDRPWKESGARTRKTSSSGRRPPGAVDHKRTNVASLGVASTSDPSRNCSQDFPENVVLHFKCSGAVVLVVSCRHHDDEIELRNDADVLATATERP